MHPNQSQAKDCIIRLNDLHNPVGANENRILITFILYKRWEQIIVYLKVMLISDLQYKLTPLFLLKKECILHHISAFPPPTFSVFSYAIKLTNLAASLAVSISLPARTGFTNEQVNLFVPVSSWANILTKRLLWDERICRYSLHHCLAYTKKSLSCSATLLYSRFSWVFITSFWTI